MYYLHVSVTQTTGGRLVPKLIWCTKFSQRASQPQVKHSCRTYAYTLHMIRHHTFWVVGQQERSKVPCHPFTSNTTPHEIHHGPMLVCDSIWQKVELQNVIIPLEYGTVEAVQDMKAPILITESLPWTQGLCIRGNYTSPAQHLIFYKCKLSWTQ